MSEPDRLQRLAPGRGAYTITLVALVALAALVLAPATSAEETIFDLGALSEEQGFTISNDSDSFDTRLRVGGAIGDINDDGHQDFAWNGTDTGSGQPIYVIFGQPGGFPGLLALSGLNGTNGFVISDQGGRLLPAESIERAGDLNGDGIDDFAVGAHRRNDFMIDSVGFVVYGRQGAFPAAFDHLDLDGTNGFFIEDYSLWPTGPTEGVFMREAGDVNGDGRGDLFIGLPDADSEPQTPALSPGAAFLIYGRASDFPGVFALDDIDGTNGFLIPPLPESSDVFRQEFAKSGGYVGDLNGDGRDDFAVGLPFAMGQESIEGVGLGRVEVIYGRAADFPATLELATLAAAEGFSVIAAAPPDDVDDLGWSLTDLGDFDGDGFDDLLIGSPGSSPPGQADTGSGAAFVIYGASGIQADLVAGTGGDAGEEPGDGISQSITALVPIEVEIPPDLDPEPDAVAVGLDVAAGDVNGDGVADAVIGNGGSTSVDPRPGAGVSFVVFGQRGERPSSIDILDLGLFQGYRIVGNAADFAGLSIDAADISGADGRAEVLVAGEGFHDEPDGSLIGAVKVIRGGAEPGIFADDFESGDLTAWSSTGAL